MSIRRQEASLRGKYSHYHDPEECFPDDSTEIDLDRFNKIPIITQMQEMQQRENRALLGERLCRDQCSNLKKRIRELEDEKEAVRYFWRNQVLEGQSRGGKILKQSLLRKMK